MADGASASIPDLNRMVAEIQGFAPAIRERLLKGGCATAASVLRVEAVRRAPVYDEVVPKGHPPAGTLAKAIYQARWPDKCTSTTEVWFVDVKKGKRFRNVGRNTSRFGPVQTNFDAFYASWVEYGHFTRAPSGITKTAKAAARALGVTTFVPPHPFMRPAFEAKKGAALEAMRLYLAQKMPVATVSNLYLKAA
jgi:hypothetical protein